MQDKTKVDLVSSEVSGLDILIQNGWMEQPPQKIEHRVLARLSI